MLIETSFTSPCTLNSIKMLITVLLFDDQVARLGYFITGLPDWASLKINGGCIIFFYSKSLELNPIQKAMSKYRQNLYRTNLKDYSIRQSLGNWKGDYGVMDIPEKYAVNMYFTCWKRLRKRRKGLPYPMLVQKSMATKLPLIILERQWKSIDHWIVSFVVTFAFNKLPCSYMAMFFFFFVISVHV